MYMEAVGGGRKAYRLPLGPGRSGLATAALASRPTRQLERLRFLSHRLLYRLHYFKLRALLTFSFFSQQARWLADK